MSLCSAFRIAVASSYIHSLILSSPWDSFFTQSLRPTQLETMANPTTFTRRQIEGLIAKGDDIVIFDGTVLRLNAWKDSHPGGAYVIQHMVGRDATDEMNM